MLQYAKAIIGALVAGLTSLQASLDGGVTAQEGVTAAIAALVALGVIYGVPNAAPPVEP